MEQHVLHIWQYERYYSCFYVDDCMAGCNTLAEAENLADDDARFYSY